MILKGSQRAGASALAEHLMNERDNDHIAVLEMTGFIADDLHDALREVHAISKATQCKQYLFSLSLSPPPDHVGSEHEFLDAVDRAEAKLGLTGQPRAIILHEKEGRLHAHAVWSRIDGEEMKAINLSHYKTKLRDLAKDLFLDHGWALPEGLQTYGGKCPLNFSLAEWQEAKRRGVDPREIKQVFREAWERSDTLNAFAHAMEERGYFLAKGYRRGFVATDVQGSVYSLPRWLGENTKAVKAKLGSPEALDPVVDVQARIKSRLTDQIRSFIAETRAKHQRDAQPLMAERDALVAQHRAERNKMKEGQAKRWTQETQARQARLNGGLRGLFDRLTGKYKIIQKQNEREAVQSAKRDQAQRDAMVKAQMTERKLLQKRIVALRTKQAQDRKILAWDIGQFLSKRRQSYSPEYSRVRQRERGPDLSR